GFRLDAAADRHRSHLGRKGALLPGGDRPLMTLGGEAVLLGPRHAALGGDVLGGLAHVPVLESAPEAIVDHGIDGLLIAVFPAATSAEKQVRRPAHALRAAADDQLGIPAAKRLGS